MKHFIPKKESVVLKSDFFKAAPSNPSKRDIEEHVWHLVSEKYPQKDAVSAFHEVMNNLKVESGLRQFRRSGKVIESEAGALGMGQQIPSTAKKLGIDPRDWRQGVEGMVKYKTQLADQARQLGVPESDVRKVASGSYFTGGSERPENQAILDAVRKKNPNVTMRDIITQPQYRKERRGLKGMSKLMARHGVAEIAPSLEKFKAETPEDKQFIMGESGKPVKRHPRAVQDYISAVHKDPKSHMKLDAKRGGGYEPVGSTRAKAEQYGTRGYVKRDPATGEGVASMPIHHSRVRETPQHSVAERSLPAPAVVRPPGQRPASSSVAAPGTGKFNKSIKFKSELFIEV
jgi:hypothetical protein